MTVRDPERLKRLLRQNRLKKRATVLVDTWASHGVKVSPIAHVGYWKLLDQLHGGRSWPLDWVDDLTGSIQLLVGDKDMILIMGWDVTEEPALLISSRALLGMVAKIATIYPDGFVLINDRTRNALLVDIDEGVTVYANRIELRT